MDPTALDQRRAAGAPTPAVGVLPGTLVRSSQSFWPSLLWHSSSGSPSAGKFGEMARVSNLVRLMIRVGTGPQVAFRKSSPALPDWSLPVPDLRTPMRLTSFPELRPTVHTTTLGRLKAIWPQRRGPLRITAPNQSRRAVTSAAREAFPAPSASLRPQRPPKSKRSTSRSH